MDGQADCKMDGWVCRWMGRQIDGLMHRWMGCKVDGWVCRQIGRQVVRWVYTWRCRWMKRQIDLQQKDADGWMDN